MRTRGRYLRNSLPCRLRAKRSARKFVELLVRARSRRRPSKNGIARWARRSCRSAWGAHRKSPPRNGRRCGLVPERVENLRTSASWKVAVSWMPIKRTDPFEMVRTVGLALPGVEAGTKYDGSPALKLGGRFMAGLATHPSAEPDTLVVRVGSDERACLIEDAPDTYYLTDYYRRHPVVLVRLARIDRDALGDLLSVSWRLTLPKARKIRRPISPGRSSRRGLTASSRRVRR